MEFRPALNRWKRFTDRRGAVLLLAVYFTSLTLLVLGGIALQRTMTESRASQTSRNNQQAFFLAEGTLDFVMKQLEAGDLPDGCYWSTDEELCTQVPEMPTTQMPGMLPNASFTLKTTSTRIVDQNTQEITHTITADGAALESSATVTATVASIGPIKGVWTNGPIEVWGWDFLGGLLGMGNTGLLQGDLRSALGTVNAIKLFDNVQHQGQLQIRDQTPTTDQEAWQIPSGSDWNEKPGVYLQPFDVNPPPTTPREPAIAPMSPPAPVVSPYTASQCSGNITTTNGQQLTIQDGNLNPKDLSGSSTDNVIVLCLQYLQNTKAGAKVIFESPATVYLAGKNTDGYALRAGGSAANDVYTVQGGQPVPGAAPLTPSGLKIIVTKAADGTGGKVSLYSKRFAGSIYAPESSVDFSIDFNGEYRLENIIGRKTFILTLGMPLSIDNPPADPQMATTTVTIKSWSSQ